MGKSSSPKSRTIPHKKKNRFRSQPEGELIWGVHPVLEALQACPQAIREIFVEKDKRSPRLEQVLELARQQAVPVRDISETLTTGRRSPVEPAGHERSQGVTARVILPVLALETMLDKLRDAAPPVLVLALDSIQDPHNLGAIIRSAAAAGVHGIIVPKDRSAPITGTVIKTSAGAVFHIDICRVTNLAGSLKILKENGIWIFGTARDAAQPVYETDLTVPACLVIGSEEKGLRPLVAEQCDLTISIPMQSGLDSLNASVAAAIILFETVRQRRHLQP